ncbi:MAG: tetratricopeptide repeat protein [Cytophagales bacterium]|nr:tetratricopeptide repeat protein [Bernardetiaceae bacterium]MDW8203772.1 tetratricopeptide repeat protein [Cytophagales bacterium]
MVNNIKRILLLLFLGVGWAICLQAQDEIELANEYYMNGEFDKAISIYSKLVRNKQYVYEVHKNYLDALLKLQQLDEAEKYLRRQIRAYPTEGLFNVDYGIVLGLMGRREEAQKHFESFIASIRKDDNLIKYAARYFINANLFDYAEQLYLMGRKNGNDKFIYELAVLYSLSGKIDKMIEEYMELLTEGERQLDYVQSVLQSRIRDEESFAKMENILIRYLQKYPDQIVFNEMMLWYYIQLKDFNKALIQAKAIDRRKKLEGMGLYELGMIAIENKDYQNAIKIFEYIVEKYPSGDLYPIARRMLIKSREEVVKNTFPIDIQKIRQLANDYAKMLSEVGLRESTAEAARSMALLQAFYLDNKDTAIAILEKIIVSPATAGKRELVAQAKLDLGDIYLLKGEPWESTLLYAQVEKAEKNTNIGQLAKLRNARLSYFKGDFEFAKEYLDVLKEATSREIANDAMQLSLLIGDNLELDTAETTLREFAAIELLVFQNKFDEALARYAKMLLTYPGHSLTDEIYWAQANIYIKRGQFGQAIERLKKIAEEHADDILADDAIFTMGKIYEENLKDKAMAMQMYQDVLTKCKGSVYTAEARRRFRTLRGDNIN